VPSTGQYLIIGAAAALVTFVITPVVIAISKRVGWVYEPNERTVHTRPIPDVGGIALFVGFGSALALARLLDWFDPLFARNSEPRGVLYAAALMFLVGLLDDVRDISAPAKVFGTVLVGAVLVSFGVTMFYFRLPFLDVFVLSDDWIPLITVLWVLGMSSAINLIDGLDGLAAGIVMIGAFAFFLYAQRLSELDRLTEPNIGPLVAIITVGICIGFLPHNFNPARVFMGDGGSQFLGFALGVLAVLLTQRDNPALSPMLPLLVLGLPIADILVVFWKRARAGGSWFRATKNHVHHRLLELGFHHYESVAVIYTLQAALVFAAVSLPYAGDGALLTIYLGVCIALFMLLRRAEAAGWRVHAAGDPGRIARFLSECRGNPKVQLIPKRIVAAAVALFMLAGAFGVSRVPADLAVIAAVLALALLVRLVLGYRVWFLMLRLLIFMAIALVVYLCTRYPAEGMLGLASLEYAFFGILALAIIVSVRLVETERFRVTPLDYLVVLIALALALVPEASRQASGAVEMALHAILLFYGAELAMRQMQSRWNFFTGAMLVSVATVAVRGLV